MNTTAKYDQKTKKFIIHSPTKGSRKNWISQGLTAEWAVVVADLSVDGVRRGPHAFLVRMRDYVGGLTRGVTTGDMGEKTTGRDLDNAWVAFTNFEVPREALLDRYVLRVSQITTLFSHTRLTLFFTITGTAASTNAGCTARRRKARQNPWR